MHDVRIDPRWHLCEETWEPERNQVWESLCALGNGYLGVRGHPDEPFDAGPSLVGTYVAGVYAPDADGIPELVNIPNVFAAEILLSGQRLRLRPERVSEYVRQLDLRGGLLRRSFVYTCGDRATRVYTERFVSRTAPHLGGQQLAVTPLNWSGRVHVRLWVDGRVRNRSRRHLRLLHAGRPERDCVLLVAQTEGSAVRIGTALRSHSWTQQASVPAPVALRDAKRVGSAYAVELECGQRAVFDRLVAVHTSRDPDSTDVGRQCVADLGDASGRTYGALKRGHRGSWQRVWNERDIELDGPDEDQRALRFAVFQLVAAEPYRDASVSIGAKALTGEAYRGHVFWDTEVFMLPFYDHTNPRAARNLLEYRRRTLPGARDKARNAGYRGAMFAWESADTGQETCPMFVPDPKSGAPVRVWCGEIEQHISADVVYGAYRHWLATGDQAFHDEVLTEMAIETARFWASRVEWDPVRAQYQIRDVIGPDEYHEHVDNNAFTNYMAAWNLRLGAACAQLLLASRSRGTHTLRLRLRPGVEEAAAWEHMASALYVPFHPRRNLHEQHEGFFALQEADATELSTRVSPEPESVRMPRIWSSQVLKQADVVMLMVLWPERFPLAVKRANWRYYEPRTTHDSSLSASAHAILAADLGLRGKAYEYFRRTARTDLADLMGNTAQGLHAAAMGGTWQALVRGILGMRTNAPTPQFRPVLPRTWRRVRLSLRHRGRTYTVEADRRGVRAQPRCRTRLDPASSQQS